DAPRDRPLPPRPPPALPAHRQAAGGARASHHRDDDVPRDGHAVLPGAGGSGDEGTNVIRSVTRRAFLVASIAGLAAPLAAEAQPAGKVYRIAYLANGTMTTSAPAAEGFRQGLRELGWVEGKNVTIEYRWADGNLDRLPALAAELLRASVDV